MTSPRPFFSKPPAGAEPERRLFVISYHFPPSVLVGGLRWQKLSRAAAERGWGVDVICLDPADLGDTDLPRLDDLPAGVRVFGVPQRSILLRRAAHAVWASLPQRQRMRLAGAESARPSSVARSEVRLRWTGSRELVRAYGAWVRYAELHRWAEDAAAVACEILEPRHRAVVSSGPPHEVHEAARLLSRLAGIPAVIDMRDPWSLNQRVSEDVASPLHFRLAARAERRIVADAALVVANTELAEGALRQLYPEAAERVITVMNGSDDDPLPAPRRNCTFVVAYGGTIYLDRDPRSLFRAAARVIADLGLSPEQFALCFAGRDLSAPGATVRDIARAEGIEAYVSHREWLSREEVARFLAGAAMLLSLPQDSDMAIPAKVFEYVRHPAWLLAMADAESATGRALRGTSADVVPPNDVGRLAAVLRRRYLEYAAGAMPSPTDADGRLGRAAQARILFDRIDSLL